MRGNVGLQDGSRTEGSRTEGAASELMSPVSPVGSGRRQQDGSVAMSPVGSDTRAAALSPLYCGSSAGRARLVQTRSGWERRTFPHQTNTPSREIRKHGAKQDEESQFWQSARLHSVVAGSAQSVPLRRRSSRKQRRDTSGRLEAPSPEEYRQNPHRRAQSQRLRHEMGLSTAQKASRRSGSGSGRLPVASLDELAHPRDPSERSSGAEQEVVQVFVRKDDEVNVETEPGVFHTGRVRATWESRPARDSSSSANLKDEILVRFEVGGGWFPREDVTFVSRPEEPAEPSLLRQLSGQKLRIASPPRHPDVRPTLITDLIAGRMNRATHE